MIPINRSKQKRKFKVIVRNDQGEVIDESSVIAPTKEDALLKVYKQIQKEGRYDEVEPISKSAKRAVKKLKKPRDMFDEIERGFKYHGV